MSQPADQSGPVETMLASDAATRMFGIEVLDYGEGWARAQLTVRDDMVNGHGICHGGVIFALADSAFACACNSWGPVTVAAGADIVFIAPVRRGDILTAEARMRARYGRNGIYDVAITRGDQVVAEFRGRSHEMREPRPSGGPLPESRPLSTAPEGRPPEHSP
jgi:acyl-CoA thioesterase